jgi:hypothetical protein
MAIAITTFQAQDGKIFNSEFEADAHDIAMNNKVEIDAFVALHFPAKEGSTKANPHAGTAAKAITLWLTRPQVEARLDVLAVDVKAE